MKTSSKVLVAFFVMFVAILTAKTSANAMMLVESEGGVFVNGTKVEFPDAEPFTDSQSRIQVPVRPVCEALGAELDWNEKTQTVTITRGKITVKLVINSNAIDINGAQKQMDTAATIKQGRTYVPVRFVSEAFGAKVDWIKEQDSVFITLAEETDMADAASLAQFEANHRVFVAAISMYIAEHDGDIPQSFDDLTQYFTDIDMYLNSPAGAMYVITVDAERLTLLSRYKEVIITWDTLAR